MRNDPAIVTSVCLRTEENPGVPGFSWSSGNGFEPATFGLRRSQIADPLLTACPRGCPLGMHCLSVGSAHLCGIGITGHSNDGPEEVVITPAAIAASTSAAQSKSPEPFESKATRAVA
jgi:hypothetical protein